MINLHIVRNTVRNDSRVLKESTTLRAARLFSSVEVVGLNDPCLPTEETLDGVGVRRIDLRSRGWPKGLVSQIVKFAEWRHRIVRLYGRAPLSVVHCHDLDPLPIAVALKARTGARIVYDAHELETEQGESSKLRVALAKRTERRLIRCVDAVITVSPSIGAWYQKEYGPLRVDLVRNIPVRPEGSIRKVDLRSRYGIPDDALLFIYVGALSAGRGIEELMDVFGSPGVRHHIVFMGYGQLLDAIDRRAAECARLHLHAAVAPSDVLSHTAGADVGVSLIRDTCLSNRYCLPNKLFECVMAGLPVMVSDLPEQRDFVQNYAAGWCTATDRASILRAVQSIGREECAAMTQGLAQRTAALGWHQEADVLLGVYRDLLGETARCAAS